MYKINKRGDPNKSERVGFFFKRLSGGGDVYSRPKRSKSKFALLFSQILMFGRLLN